MHSLRLSFLGFLLFIVGSLSWADQYEPFQKSGKYGLKNITSGEIVITPQFQSIGWSDGSFQVTNNLIGAKQNERWALINLNSNKVSDHSYSILLPFTSNLFIAAKRSSRSILINYGLINSKGKTVLNHDYSKLEKVGDQLIASKKVVNSYKTGVLNKNGKVIISVEYASINSIEPGFYQVKDNKGLSAMYSKEGKELTAFQFESIEKLNEELFSVTFYNRRGLIDKAGKTITPPIYKNIQLSGDKARALPFTRWDLYEDDAFKTSLYFDDVQFSAPNRFSISSGDNIGIINSEEAYQDYRTSLKSINTIHGMTIISNPSTGYQGVIDSNGKAVIPINYDSIVVFEKIIFGKIEKRNNQNWSVFDKTGKKLNLNDYQSFENENQGLIRASRNGKIGFLNKGGSEASPFLYDSVSVFRNSLAVAKYQESFGVIDKRGYWIVTPYNDSIAIKNNIIFLKQGSESKILNQDGELLARTYEDIYPLSQGYYQTTNDGLALFNFDKERLLEPTYDSIKMIHSDLYWLTRDNRYFFYRPSDRADFELDSDINQIGEFNEGYMPVLKDNQWGYIDERGNLRIANRYQAVDKFSEGLSAVKLIGKWGYVDKDENLVLQPTYDEAAPFHNGLAVVKKAKKYGLINKNGDVVISEDYSEIKRFENYILLQNEKLFGLADQNGKLIRSPQYDQISPLSDDYFLVEKAGLKGVIKRNGLDVVPIAYSEIRHLNNQFIGSENSDWVLLELK